jgi:hypothetical protein
MKPNEHETKRDERSEYSEPTIVDYGTLNDLTAAGGSKFEDTPIGTPIGNVTASSTP